MNSVILRSVKRKDWDFILKLRNTEEFRNNFEHQHIISKQEHYNYLKKQMDNHDFLNRIICFKGKDVGYIRVLNSDISIIIDKKFHGKGIGTAALKIFENEAKNLGVKKLVGRVMIHNKSSKKIFLNNKYKLKLWWYEKKLDSINENN